jgi:hypothetical protein
MAFVGFVVVWTLKEVAFDAVCHFQSKAPLDLSPAQSPGDPGAMLPMAGISRAYAQQGCLGSTQFAPALFEFPAIHSRSPFVGESCAGSISASKEGNSSQENAKAGIRQTALQFWIPAFDGMTIGDCQTPTYAKVRAPALRASKDRDGRQACTDTELGPHRGAEERTEPERNTSDEDRPAQAHRALLRPPSPLQPPLRQREARPGERGDETALPRRSPS